MNKITQNTIISGFCAFLVWGFLTHGQDVTAETTKADAQQLQATLDECGGGYAAQMWHWRSQGREAWLNDPEAGEQIKATKELDREKGDNLTMQMLRGIADHKGFEQLQREITRQANEAGDDTIDQMYQQDILSCVWDVVTR